MRKRLFAALAGAIAIALLVGAGISQGKSTGKAAKAAPSGTVTLNGWQASPEEEDLLRKVVADFQASHPNIKVNYDSFNNYQATMLAKFSARKPPDVFYVAAEDFNDWVRQGILEPLDPFAKKSKFKTNKFFPRLLNTFKYKGKSYGYPKDWSPLAMEVNTRLLGGRKIPTTWAQLKSVASKINVPDGKPICFSADWARLMAFVYQAGGSGQWKDATSKPFRTAVNYYVGLVKSGLAATPDKLASGWCGEAFGKEHAAFAFEGNWMMPYMRDTFPNVKFKLAPLPKGKARGNLGFTVSYSIARDSKNKDAAWELVKYLTGKQGMTKWTSLGLALPARSDIKPVSGRGAFVKAAPYTHGWGNAPKFRTVWEQTANNELTAVLQGKESVNTMLSKIAAAAR